jgi:hypothetical protein
MKGITWMMWTQRHISALSTGACAGLGVRYTHNFLSLRSSDAVHVLTRREFNDEVSLAVNSRNKGLRHERSNAMQNWYLASCDAELVPQRGIV